MVTAIPAPSPTAISSPRARLLVTTADEASWGRNRPLLFLGEWCKRESRRPHWSALDTEQVAYHWNDRKQLHADYLYLQGVNEKTLHALVDWLNRQHGTAHSERYWRIVVGPWLGYFVQILFDRWKMIKIAAETHNISGTIIVEHDQRAMVIQSMADFAPMFTSDDWNHWIYGQIIRRCTDIPVLVHQVESSGSSRNACYQPRATSPASARYIRHMAKVIVSTVSRSLAGTDYFFINSCIGQQWRLEAALGQLPTFWAAPEIPHARVDCELRSNSRIKLGGQNEFESLVAELVLLQIPSSYLEGYRSLVKQTQQCVWPRRLKVIFTSSAHNTNEFFKVWAASQVERGAKLVIGQHGGHFGIGRWVFHEDHECKIADRYFSWGWSNPRQRAVVPLPSAKLSDTARSLKSDPQGGLLLVLASMPRYSYWMYSLPVASQMLDYLEDQLSFAAQLTGQARDQLTVRLYPHDFGWDLRERWCDRFPNARFDDPNRSMYDSIRKSRLFIATYNATTYLETFAAGVPTVMFWNPRHWEIRPEAEADFEQLRAAGILFDSPEAAAAQVSRIWDDVDGWWNSTQIQACHKLICDKYARTSKDWVKDWTCALREVANETTISRPIHETDERQTLR